MALTIIFTEAMPTFALTSENKAFPYYTNLNHVELTEAQYNNLARVFDEDTIATFTQDMVDILANDTALETRGHSKYIKTDTVVDFLGNVISTTDTEVTEEEAMEFIENPPVQLKGYPVHQTTMKRLTINVTAGSLSSKTITVTCE